MQALETLAVVAYKQPVTAPEISEIRGVDSGGVLGSLMARKLVTTAGRKQVIGRPILYKTTRDFLLRFGLKDINELPSIEEFEKMAGELAEQEEIPMEHHAPETAEDLQAEKHTHLATGRWQSRCRRTIRSMTSWKMLTMRQNLKLQSMFRLRTKLPRRHRRRSSTGTKRSLIEASSVTL